MAIVGMLLSQNDLAGRGAHIVLEKESITTIV